MDQETFYLVYCSRGNNEIKKKMSWKKYLGYISLDGKSKGYHFIPKDLITKVPTKCPFGHPIKENLTVTIDTPVRMDIPNK